MARTLADALESDEGGMDYIAVLRDKAVALAHLHDQGIVHRNVTPSIILLSDDTMEAKLSHCCTARLFSTPF